MTPVPPSDRKGLHPLCVPLAKGCDADGVESTVCIMVSPADCTTTSVVAATAGRDYPTLPLPATSSNEYFLPRHRNAS